ncbi:MAG: HEAT repeat domain-containing protein [Polyangia bacterium]
MKRLLLAALLLSSASAHADDVATLRRDLQVASDARADEAAKQLAASKDPKAIEAILDLLALGIPPRQAQVLLGGLAGRKDARSFDVLVVFSHNRNSDLRRRAIELLGQLPDAKVVPSLMLALSDSTPEVRAAAAEALGHRKERSAERKLMQLLEHRDQSAPAALAAIATPELAHKLAERIGPIPDALLCETFGEILRRVDFGPDPVRVEIVKTLAKIPGDVSTTALIEYMQATEHDPKRPSRLEAESVVNHRKGT